jgi:hypothetical protein
MHIYTVWYTILYTVQGELSIPRFDAKTQI